MNMNTYKFLKSVLKLQIKLVSFLFLSIGEQRKKF